jgi:hypothetical protein
MKSYLARIRRAYKGILAVIGIGSLVTLGTLSAAHGGMSVGPGPRLTAGSGSAATNTVYRQPVVGGMTIGATATWTTSASEPQITRAMPNIGGH